MYGNGGSNRVGDIDRFVVLSPFYWFQKDLQRAWWQFVPLKELMCLRGEVS